MNEIRMLQINEEEWVTGQDQVKDVLIKHFKELLRANGEVNNYWLPPNIGDSLVTKLTEAHIQILQREICEQEVRQAVFQMGGLKAPRPEGIPAIFFHKAWEVMGKEVTEEMLHFFRTGYLLKEWNQTLISSSHPKGGQSRESFSL